MPPMLDASFTFAELCGFGSLKGVANRDIKLENTLLDGSPRPLIKVGKLARGA